MAEITWSKLALDDLDSIHDYIAKESSFMPKKLLKNLLKGFQCLPHTQK
jgi:plasmid stabilization system protein ParE